MLDSTLCAVAQALGSLRPGERGELGAEDRQHHFDELPRLECSLLGLGLDSQYAGVYASLAAFFQVPLVGSFLCGASLMSVPMSESDLEPLTMSSTWCGRSSRSSRISLGRVILGEISCSP